MDVEEKATSELLLKTVPPHHQESVRKAIEANGLVGAISEVVTNYWDATQQQDALEKIFKWNQMKEKENAAVEKEEDEGVYVKILIDTFHVDKHLRIVQTHKQFVEKVFRRFGKMFPNVTDKQIKEHDLSKYSLIEMVGYTDRWIWNLNTPAWSSALRHHYLHNPHHPQHFNGGGPMDTAHLEESVVDMMACQWERVEGGRDGATAAQVATCPSIYLERYHKEDREKVQILIQKIVDSDL